MLALSAVFRSNHFSWHRSPLSSFVSFQAAASVPAISSSASAMRRMVARSAVLYSCSSAVIGMVQSFLGFDLAQEIDDALERGGGAVGLPLDARENRDLDLGVACGHPMIPMMRRTYGSAHRA